VLGKKSLTAKDFSGIKAPNFMATAIKKWGEKIASKKGEW
jgi:hypothetical protein